MISEAVIKKCTGCNLCAEVCPVNAILYKEDYEGFLYPVIDEDKCIDCGKCNKFCPLTCGDSFSKNFPQVYASWTLNDEIRMASTSGGVFYELAEQYIKNGDIVVGAIYGDDWRSAHHILANSEEDLKRVIGSKYFQSDLRGIYTKIKNVLAEGKKVLFCGAPCQSAAIQSFLKDDSNVNNLVTVDFICLGINSPLAFKSFLDELEEKYCSKVIYVQLKNKIMGWNSLATYVKFQNGKEYLKTVDECKWIRGYIKGGGLYIRKSCYDCLFRGNPRVSDITIGDFWGCMGYSNDENRKGISTILINSSKGKELIESVKQNLWLERKEYDELLAGNPALIQSPVLTEQRKYFFQCLKEKGFEQAVLQNSDVIEKKRKPSVLTKIENCLLFPLKMIRFIKYRILFFKEISFYQYYKYNYFSKNIVRDKNSFIIPYKGTVLDIDKTAKIYLKGKNLEIGINKLKGSRSETHVRLGKNAVWKANNGCGLFYNTVLEVCENALLETGYFTANGGSTIICAKHIVFGDDVMLGRNILIYDSDHHQVLDSKMKMCNFPQDVIIEDHVWLTSNILVQKGVRIGRDSIIAAFTTINKDVDSFTLVGGKSTGKFISNINGWSRKSTNV